jgi:hypothetical protein
MDECFHNSKAPVLEGAWFPRATTWEPPEQENDLVGGWEFPDLELVGETHITFVTEVQEVSLAEKFRTQADKWARETQHLSSPSQMMAHPSYQAILGMAQENKREIIRLLLLDLQENRNEWFWALSYLTQDNPIKPSDAGKMDRMISTWLNWGRKNGFI